MLNNLLEVVQTFSFRSILKTNIIGSMTNMHTGSLSVSGVRNNTLTNLTSNKLLSTYYLRSQEIREYENTELSNTAVTILSDYVINYINKDTKLIDVSNQVPNYEKIDTLINNIFNSLDIVNEVKNHIWDIIYNGRYCFKTQWNEDERRYDKFSLQYPCSVVTIKDKNKVKSHLVVSRDRQIYEVNPDSIFTIGKADLNLINDMNDDYWKDRDEDTLIQDTDFYAGTPLYYNISGKVKEYLLKDQILTLLSIKDLIQPLLLLLSVDKNTSPDEASKLALTTENLINKYSDISSILSANFSINDLIDAILNNIRVLPDYNSAVGGMNSVDLTKISEKINEIRSDQDNLKETIFTSISIPRSLYSGDSTRWDAIKSSQRLNSRINSIVTGISDSIQYQAQRYTYLSTGKLYPLSCFTCNLFTKTDVDYNTAISNADMVGQLMDSINRIIDGAQRTLQENQLVDKKSYAEYIMNQLKVVDKDSYKFFNESTIKLYIDKLIKEEESKSNEGDMY